MNTERVVRKIIRSEERELMALFRSLPDLDQQALLRQAREWADATRKGSRAVGQPGRAGAEHRDRPHSRLAPRTGSGG
jgi:hypothetical protein